MIIAVFDTAVLTLWINCCFTYIKFCYLLPIQDGGRLPFYVLEIAKLY